MSYRYTDTCKWADPWYYSLNPLEKLTFNYLCDNCDIAGFIELNIPKWASEIGVDQSKIKAALEGLQRGFIFSVQKDCLYIRNFLKHQKNLPLNENNPAHRGIISRFSSYSYKFDFEDINEFIKGASKGLPSPIGNGKGNGKGNEWVKIQNNVSKNSDFIQQILDTFCEAYVRSNLQNYEVVSPGKERKAIGQILALHKKKHPNLSSEETLDGLKKYFELCCGISDRWLRQNMSPSIIVSKFNEINKILRNDTGISAKEYLDAAAERYARGE